MKVFLALVLSPALALAQFDYKSENTDWCAISETCCNGQLQSPLDIQTDATAAAAGGAAAANRATNRVVHEIQRAEAWDRQDTEARSLLSWSGGYNDDQQGTLSNTGSSIQFKPRSTSEVITGGPLGTRQFKLIYYNFHWPAEHKLDGVSFDGELHLVHQNILDDNDLAIVSFLLRDSDSNNKRSPWLDQIVNPGYNLKKTGDSIDITLNLNSLFKEAKSLTNYAYYKGSLTTPNCDENVDWIVMLNPVEIKREQLKTFSTNLDFNGNAMESNNRPIQPGNLREVRIIQEV